MYMVQTKTKSIDYIMLSNQIQTPIEHKERHDEIEHYIHCKVLKYLGIVDCEKQYKQLPKAITETREAIFLKGLAI